MHSRMSPSTPGDTRSPSRTCGMRAAQLAKMKPLAMKAVETAVLGAARPAPWTVRALRRVSDVTGHYSLVMDGTRWQLNAVN